MSRLTVNRNKDGTITVRFGRAVEHIGTDGKTHGQVFEAVKTAAFSKGARPSDVALIEMLHKAGVEA